MIARMAAAARIHQSQAQLLGISTGGLMARISLVRATGDGGGRISAELFVIIERKSGSAVEAAAFARFKEPAQRGGVGLIGAQLNEIDAHRAEQALQFLLRLGLASGEGGPFAGVTGVDLQDLAGFGILKHEPAQRRHFQFVSVGDVHAHDVVAAIGLSQRRIRGLGEAQRGGQARAREAGGGSGTMRFEKIRKHHRNGPMRSDATQELQRGVQVRAAPLRLVKEDFTDNPQDVAAAFARRHELLDFISEEDQPDFVVVANGGEGEHGSDLGGQLALGLLAGAEQSGAAQVHEQHEGQFAFLDELFDERMVHARGDVPVDGADFVSRLVFADLLEVHSLALEDAVVLPREGFADEAVGAQLDLADFPEDFAGDHANAKWGMKNDESNERNWAHLSFSVRSHRWRTAVFTALSLTPCFSRVLDGGRNRATAVSGLPSAESR